MPRAESSRSNRSLTYVAVPFSLALHRFLSSFCHFAIFVVFAFTLSHCYILYSIFTDLEYAKTVPLTALTPLRSGVSNSSPGKLQLNIHPSFVTPVGKSCLEARLSTEKVVHHSFQYPCSRSFAAGKAKSIGRRHSSYTRDEENHDGMMDDLVGIRRTRADDVVGRQNAGG